MMHEMVMEAILKPDPPDLTHIITEDDTPVDNLYSAKQQRLLVNILYSSQIMGQSFLADTNVAIYYGIYQPPIVPDMFLSLGVEPGDDWWEKENRSYLTWVMGKSPDVVVEIVSNKKGNELGTKYHTYEAMGVSYYIVYDPQKVIQDEFLSIYELQAGQYVLRPDNQLPRLNLQLMLWEGTFEGKHSQWLRWFDQHGNLIPTGTEAAAEARLVATWERRRAEQGEQRAEQERQRAEQERQRAEVEKQRAEDAIERVEEERQRAEKLAALLRAQGIDPDQV